MRVCEYARVRVVFLLSPQHSVLSTNSPTRLPSPARWQELRWRFFRLHFQYLCAFDRPGDYDYFRITAGAMTLAERYAGRPASKSRIETATSGYRTMA